jgi:hypothetical protein
MSTPIIDLAMKLIETPLESLEYPSLLRARHALSENEKTDLFFTVLWEAKSNSPLPSLTSREGYRKQGKAAPIMETRPNRRLALKAEQRRAISLESQGNP